MTSTPTFALPPRRPARFFCRNPRRRRPAAPQCPLSTACLGRASRLALVSLFVSLVALAVPARAAAPALAHMVSPGETLASIAELYYGDPRREGVLVAENGLTSEGGSAIVVGLRLVIPSVSYHQVEEGETWAAIADRFYGDPSRAFVLTEANAAGIGGNPDVGAELLIPYPLRHVVQQGESLRRIAKSYFPRRVSAGMVIIRRFNQLKHSRLVRGQILLIPLSRLTLSEKGKEISQELRALPPGGDIRAKQAAIDEQLPKLREHVERGHYADAVALANRLIGGGDLTGSQTVTIYRELGEALVALDRDDLAVQAFTRVLAQQPDAELDGVSTSPKVLLAFSRAQEAVSPTRKKPAPNPPSDTPSSSSQDSAE